MHTPLGNIPLNGVALLDHYGVIEASGEDVAKFLHGQLTQDMVLLPPGQARLAAYCTPKGRMLASFVVVKRSAQAFWLVCPRTLLGPVLKRLSMFVLRAKLKLADASESYRVWGLAGTATRAELAPDAPAWSAVALDGAHAVQLYPAAGNVRQLWVAPVDAVAPVGAALARTVWDWSDVVSGVAHVVAATSEAFVPQMLNYESVGGVSFKKGCYPGQEVVARSQFRGTLKRRTCLASASGALAAGQEVWVGDGDGAESVGTVVQAGASAQGQWHALLCLQTSAAQGAGDAGLRTQDGALLALLALPYPLAEDI
ncbi:MAG: CAF17-like 4Fe-4S cluster assembly/insertion protein YgfZ [Rhodoferax sp.]